MLTSWAQTSEGERLPSGLAEEALARKELFSTLELQTQLLYSVADQVRRDTVLFILCYYDCVALVLSLLTGSRIVCCC